MKILVAVKRVIDPYVKIRVRGDNKGVETQNVKMAMNPFDEIAVEEAIRIKEKNQAQEIIAISIGTDAVQETLRHALALGADRAIFVRTDVSLCSLDIAKILHEIVKKEQPDLVLMGKQAIDGDNNQTPQMLAALMNRPQGSFSSQLTIDNHSVVVVREVDGGLETLSLDLPAVVSTDLRLNEPRYASLPNIMKAKKKPLETIELSSLALSLKPHLEVVSVHAPSTRASGVKVDSAKTLIDKLAYEAKVIDLKEKA